MFFSAMSKVFDKQLKKGDVLAHSWGGMVDQDQLMWQRLFCHGTRKQSSQQGGSSGQGSASKAHWSQQPAPVRLSLPLKGSSATRKQYLNHDLWEPFTMRL